MQTALSDFRSSLDRVRNLANDALAKTSEAMRDRALKERHDTALSAVLVTLSGFFESFLHDVAEQYVAAVCQQQHPFTNLKARMRHTHFQGGGKVLSALGGKKPSPWYSWTSATASDVAKRLASVDSGGPYELVWEAFAETGGNPGSKVITEFLSRFGVSNGFEKLAPHTPMSGPTLSSALDSFIAVRNECAHTGQATNTPTASDVLGHCDLLDSIAAAIVTTLTAHQVC